MVDTGPSSPGRELDGLVPSSARAVPVLYESPASSLVVSTPIPDSASRACPPADDGRTGPPPWDDLWWFADLARTEERCRDYLEALRWPEGVSCPRCDSGEIGRLVARRRFWCRDCKYQFSVTSGTLFHNSHAPVWKWFLAVRLLVESDGGLPANQLVQQLGGSYKTAWFIQHRVRAALKDDAAAGSGAARRETSPRDIGDRVYDRSVVGRYRQQGVNYLEAYRAETEWLSRNAGNPDRFRDVVLALLRGKPLRYADLIDGRPVARARPAVVSAGS